MTTEDQFMCIGKGLLAALGATFAIFAISKTFPVICDKIKSRKDSIKQKFEKPKDKDQSLQSLPESKDSFKVDVNPATSNETEFFQIMTPVYLRMPLSPSDRVGNLQALPEKEEQKRKVEEADKVVELKASSEVSPLKNRNGKTKKSNATFRPILKRKYPTESSESESERVVRQRKSKSNNVNTSHFRNKTSSYSYNLDSSSDSDENDEKNSNGLNKSKENEEVENPKISSVKDKNGMAKKLKPLLKGQYPEESESERVVRQRSKSKLTKTKTTKLTSINASEGKNTTLNYNGSKVELKANVNKDVNDSVHKNVETIVTVEKRSGSGNKFDINLDMFVDPKTKKSIKLHTHAAVDKQKMNLHGKAEATEGEGIAQIAGLISHKGASNIDTMELDVIENSQDSDEVEIEAIAVKEEEKDMN